MKEYAEYISDAIVQCKIVKDDSGKIDIVAVFANKNIETVTGKKPEQVIHKGMTEVFSKLSNALFDWPKILSETAMTNDHKIIEQYVVGFDKYVRFSIFGFNGDTFYVAMQDLTEKKQMKRILMEKEREIKHLESELKARANVDMLTKLYNFQFMNDSINSSMTSYKEEGINFCLLVLDIDDFKKINKIYGMAQADKIIQEVAHILSVNARKIDVVGRYGNDKFMIILNNVDIDIAKIMAEKIKMEIEKYSLNFNSNLSACGSIVEYGGESIEEFIEKSENLTTKAQSIGKGIILS
ncbi:MAG: diguanylate cyclase [Sedimentibacter sp.]